MAIILAICLLLFFGAEAQVFGAGAPPAKIVITPASFSEREGLLIVSQNQGFFRKYKLDVELVLMPSAPIAFSALTAGESHFYYGTTSGTSLGAVLNGLDGVFVAGFINKLIGAFSVTKDIKTPNDLKGKQIGVASLGGGNWMFTMLAFDHWGLDPKRDNITFRIIGNTGVRAQSIASGIIGGSVLGYTFATNFRRDGFDEEELKNFVETILNYKIRFVDKKEYVRQLHEKIEFELPSAISPMHSILDYLTRRVERLGVVQSEQSNLFVALDEAFVNAVKHGNKFNAEKLIKITAEISPHEARFTIEDEGEGFDVNAIPDPLDPENLFKASGRGVLFIYNIMDEVKYNERGNRLTMIKK